MGTDRRTDTYDDNNSSAEEDRMCNVISNWRISGWYFVSQGQHFKEGIIQLFTINLDETEFLIICTILVRLISLGRASAQLYGNNTRWL